MLTACRSKTLVAKHSHSEVLKGLGRGYGEVEVAEMVQAEEMVDGPATTWLDCVWTLCFEVLMGYISFVRSCVVVGFNPCHIFYRVFARYSVWCVGDSELYLNMSDIHFMISLSDLSVEAIVARDSVNTTINCDVSLQITNDGVEKNNGFCRVCSFQSSEPLRNVSVESMIVASVVLDKLDGTSNKPIRKRKRTVLSFGLVKIREHCGKTMEKAVANLGVTPESALSWKASDGLADFKTAMREQFIENATASAVKQLTIKATYEENIVKFPFTLLDGLKKVEEWLQHRFQLRLGCFQTYM
ncbi:hypothetical protein Tco_0538239 [Tanacetum coccineum]